MAGFSFCSAVSVRGWVNLVRSLARLGFYSFVWCLLLLLLLSVYYKLQIFLLLSYVCVGLDCYSFFLSVFILPSTSGISSKPVLQEDFLHAFVHFPVVNHYSLLLNAYSSGREWDVVCCHNSAYFSARPILGYWRWDFFSYSTSCTIVEHLQWCKSRMVFLKPRKRGIFISLPSPNLLFTEISVSNKVCFP